MTDTALPAAARERFSGLTIFLHWFMLLLLVGIYATIELRELFPRGSDPREAMKAWHFMLGLAVLAFLAVRLGVAAMPANSGWSHMLGVALLCGIGFTMSLFIGLLAFADDEALRKSVKVGILAGSLVAAILGVLVLRLSPKPAADLDGE